MSKFGWSMPAGAWECRLPGEDDEFCEICGCDAVQCVCPECPVCKIVGNPACVGNHAPIEFWGNEPPIKQVVKEEYSPQCLICGDTGRANPTLQNPDGEICECVEDKLR